ncbi:MAG: hypothetical protein HW386_2007 [Gammaproteobacteria bacterium]|nr:hypothetical protein [Gammaproteobacteria bacterium]
MLRASTLLPPDVIRGTSHQVDENVANDGFLNTYTIHSEFGDLQATSTGTLRKYIDEIKAVARMKEIRSSEEFTKGMTEKAKDVVEGAKGLVADPVGSVSSTVSGVGKLFSRASENLTGDSRSDTEGSRMASLLGYEKAKRDIGYQFGIDVYSRNKILQDELNSLSGASGTGTLVMSGLLMAVPGGAGVAVSITGSTELMNNVMRDSAPADLRKLNRENLAAMGVNTDIADLYIANGVYTPLEQTSIVAALNNMPNTRNRAEFIKFATIIDNPDMAYFRQRQAQMYEGYNRLVEPIASFVPVGQMTAGLTNTSKIVIQVPVDYLSWTNNLAATASAVSKIIDSVQGVKERQLWITGAVSAAARDSLQQMGWVVHENSENKVGLPVY